MNIVTLENEVLQAKISLHGAELKEREWGNQLKSGEEFQTSYRIIIR